MAFYELVFIVRQDVSVADVENITTEFANLINDLGGEVIKKEYWELRTLAYKIKNNKKGHYIFLGISIDHKGLQEVERKMKYKEEIIRTNVIKVKEIDLEPSAILKNPVATNNIPSPVSAPVN